MRRLVSLFILCLIAALCGCSGGALHPCDMPDCDSEGTNLYLDDNGDRHYYCDWHYNYIVPQDMQTDTDPAPSEPRNPALCEMCDNTGVLTYTDSDGSEHLLCSDHYAQVVRLEKEESAGPVTATVCEVCGKSAILSTRTQDGEEHYYCADHYTAMLDMLG